MKAEASKKSLRTQLRTIGQQGNAQKILLFGELDRVTQQLRSISVPAELFVNHQVLQQNNKPPLRRADREEQINHADDRFVAPQNKNAPAIRLFEDQAQAAELFFFIGAKIAFFYKQFAYELG